MIRNTGSLSLDRQAVYFQDGLGSVVAVTDPQNAVTGSATYDAWGNATITGALSPYGFIGREQDETGLIYLRARYYDPAVGRFTQPDPIGLAGGINPYAYALGNPTTFVDPLGLLPQVALPSVDAQLVAATAPSFPTSKTGLARGD